MLGYRYPTSHKRLRHHQDPTQAWYVLCVFLFVILTCSTFPSTRVVVAAQNVATSTVPPTTTTTQRPAADTEDLVPFVLVAVLIIFFFTLCLIALCLQIWYDKRLRGERKKEEEASGFVPSFRRPQETIRAKQYAGGQGRKGEVEEEAEAGPRHDEEKNVKEPERSLQVTQTMILTQQEAGFVVPPAQKHKKTKLPVDREKNVPDPVSGSAPLQEEVSVAYQPKERQQQEGAAHKERKKHGHHRHHEKKSAPESAVVSKPLEEMQEDPPEEV